MPLPPASGALHICVRADRCRFDATEPDGGTILPSCQNCISLHEPGLTQIDSRHSLAWHLRGSSSNIPHNSTIGSVSTVSWISSRDTYDRHFYPILGSSIYISTSRRWIDPRCLGSKRVRTCHCHMSHIAYILLHSKVHTWPPR